MKAIWEREFRSYFQTMLGPVFVAVVVALTGIYFMVYNLVGGYPYFAATLESQLFLLLVVVPILTMKSFAEERHSRADQLLLSAPVSAWQIVLGKYFAMVAVLALPCLILCLCPFLLMAGGGGSLGSDLMAIGLYFLMGCAYIAVGMFLSSLTESQLIAAVSTFGALLLLYLWDSLTAYLPTSAGGNLAGMLLLAALIALLYYTAARNPFAAGLLFAGAAIACAVAYLADSSLFEGLLSKLFGLLDMYTGFAQMTQYRLLDLGGVAVYLSVAGFFVFLTAQSLQKRRWA